MKYNKFFKNYSNSIFHLLNAVDTTLIQKSVNLINKKIKSNNFIYIVGNGGSASISSHVSVDFSKVARVKSATFNNTNLISCFANDYGHDNWVTESIKAYCDKKDLLILISSSGKSRNMINAAQFCNKKNIDLITLSGFSKKNKLLNYGKINFHVNSTNYNYVEMIHHIILVSIVDIFTKKIN